MVWRMVWPIFCIFLFSGRFYMPGMGIIVMVEVLFPYPSYVASCLPEFFHKKPSFPWFLPQLVFPMPLTFLHPTWFHLTNHTRIHSKYTHMHHHHTHTHTNNRCSWIFFSPWLRTDWGRDVKPALGSSDFPILGIVFSSTPAPQKKPRPR